METCEKKKEKKFHLHLELSQNKNNKCNFKIPPPQKNPIVQKNTHSFGKEKRKKYKS